MDLLHVALLVAAGVAGGCMAAIVGGAAVITFPALLAAGLPPVMATAANTVALTPGLFLAAIYVVPESRRSTARSSRWRSPRSAGR